MAFTLFAICLLLRIYIFATYFQGANLCKSIFSSRVSNLTFNKVAQCTKQSFVIETFIKQKMRSNTFPIALHKMMMSYTFT